MFSWTNRKPGILAALLLVLCLAVPAPPEAARAEGSGTIELPAGIEVIEAEAFCGDETIRKAVLPEGLKRIESRAFADSALREINLPGSLEYIAEDVFENSSLQTITAPKDKESYAYQWARGHGYMSYRALVIGEKTFLGSYDNEYFYKLDVLRNSNDAKNMETMLNAVCGPMGTGFRTKRISNAGYDRIHSAIQAVFADTTDQDLSVFFIATHGEPDGGDLVMPFTGNPDSAADREAYAAKGHLSFETLAAWLSEAVQGRVVVILESCYAGAAIYPGAEPNGAKRGSGEETDRSEEIVRAAVKAFAKADPGVTVQGQDGRKGSSTGPMRLPKFYVLAAAAHDELSWGYSNTEANPVNLFTKWLIEGIGSKENSPADEDGNGDNMLTLGELYRYIKKVGDPFEIKNGNVVYHQHVQVYPENDEQEIFLLK